MQKKEVQYSLSEANDKVKSIMESYNAKLDAENAFKKELSDLHISIINKMNVYDLMRICKKMTDDKQHQIIIFKQMIQDNPKFIYDTIQRLSSPFQDVAFHLLLENNPDKLFDSIGYLKKVQTEEAWNKYGEYWLNKYKRSPNKLYFLCHNFKSKISYDEKALLVKLLIGYKMKYEIHDLVSDDPAFSLPQDLMDKLNSYCMIEKLQK